MPLLQFVTAKDAYPVRFMLLQKPFHTGFSERPGATGNEDGLAIYGRHEANIPRFFLLE